MTRPGLAYERPTRTAQALILCFSLGVVVMAGWLVMTVMFSHEPVAVAEDPADVPPIATKAPPRIEDSTPAIPPPLTATPRPPSQPGTLPSPEVRSADIGAARPAVAPERPAPAGSYGSPSIATTSPNDRASADDAPTEAGFDPREFVPLPQPRPRRTAAVPVPRPRPRVDDQASAQGPQERTLFDVLMGR